MVHVCIYIHVRRFDIGDAFASNAEKRRLLYELLMLENRREMPSGNDLIDGAFTSRPGEKFYYFALFSAR